jgi:filamentous hemagglutinin
VAGGTVGLLGSVGVDAVTGGLNLVLTPGEVAGMAAAGAAVGGAFGSTLDWLSAHGGAIFSSNGSDTNTTAAGGSGTDSTTKAPSLPSDLVGDQSDPRAGPNKGGNRHTSGPLTPENGGTGDYDQDLETLTGGTRPWQPGDKAPPGSQVGQNGIFGRPQNSSGGKSIDIPANGDKPHETLHY